jgi:hypothetical protein
LRPLARLIDKTPAAMHRDWRARGFSLCLGDSGDLLHLYAKQNYR